AVLAARPRRIVRSGVRAQLRTIAVVALFVTGAVVSGCSGNGARLEPDVVQRASCDRGERVACTCAGGVAGEQVCDADASFGACTCAPGDGGADGGQTCAPGASVPCACAG